MTARPRIALAAAVGALALVLAGCGNSRTTPPSLYRSAAPTGFRTVTSTRAHVRLRIPTNWTLAPEQPPLMLTLTSGSATVALWRYPRAAPPPAGTAALAVAQTRLIDAARRRDPSLQLIRSGIVTLEGTRAIELDATEQIVGALRRVRSTHLFVPGAEIVLEEFAPPASFHSVDHSVFSPLKRSLTVL